MVDRARRTQDDILNEDDSVLPADDMDVQEAALDDDEDFEEDIDDED